MTTTDTAILNELRRDMKMLREDFAKFRQAEHKKEADQWVTADLIMKRFGVTAKELEGYRKQNVIKFKQLRKYAVRYSLQSCEQFFNHKNTIS